MTRSLIQPPPQEPIRALRFNPPTVAKTLKTTIKLVGHGIRKGAEYPPLQHHAARLASKAAPKDYLGQAKAIWDDLIENWRYVKDPIGTEKVTISGPAIYHQILGAGARPGTRGYGDCDDISALSGALFRSIGLPVMLATTANRKTHPKAMLSHIFLKVQIPKLGWITFDPVVYPNQGFAETPRHTRIAYWDLHGRFLGKRGRFPRQFRGMLGSLEIEGEEDMSEQFRDIGLEAVFGSIPTYQEDPDLPDYAEDGVDGFGCYTPTMGLINGDNLPDLMMEYTDDDIIKMEGVGEVVRTKMLEIDPDEYAHILRTGSPKMGCVALSDDGEVYQWQPAPEIGLGGWFKKIFKKIGKGIKKVGRAIKKGVKKGIKYLKKGAKWLIRKLPGGKWLLKMYGKLKKIAMKLVRPLMKFVGKWAKKLAPIAAMIPGYGPAIAAGLYTAGKIANIMKKTGVLADKKGRPKFRSDKHAKVFRKRLSRAAEGLKRKKRRTRRRGRSLGRRRGRWAGIGAAPPPKPMMVRPRRPRGLRRRRRLARRMKRMFPLMRLMRRYPLRAYAKSQAWRKLQARKGRQVKPVKVFKPGTRQHAQVLKGLGFGMYDFYEN